MNEVQTTRLVTEEIERDKRISRAYKVIALYAQSEQRGEELEARFTDWLTAEDGYEERMEAFRMYFFEEVFDERCSPVLQDGSAWLMPEAGMLAG